MKIVQTVVQHSGSLNIVYGVQKLDGSGKWLPIETSPSGFYKGYIPFPNDTCPDSDMAGVFISIDALTVITKGIYTAEELGIPHSVRALLGLLTNPPASSSK